MPPGLTVTRADGTTSRTQVLIALETAVAAALAMFPEMREAMPVWAYFAAFVGLRGVHAYLRATTTQPLQ